MTRKFRRLALSAVASVLVLAGCTSGGAEEKEAGSNGEPKQGGTLRVAVPATPTGYPITQAGGLADNIVGKFLTEGLTRYGRDSLTVVEPALATAWSSNEDATVWTFELREDVSWHDGEAFDADDVKFTMDLIATEGVGARSAGQVSALERVRIIDDYTVEMVFSEPHSSLPVMLAYNMGILPEHVMKDEDPLEPTRFLENPVGTGPFKFTSASAGSNWVMERNDDWWGGEVLLDELVFAVVPDMNATVAQLRSGDIDMALIQPGQSETLESAGGVEVSAVPQVNYFYVATSNDVAPFDNVEVRRALNYAIDKESIISGVLRDFGTPAVSPIPPALDRYFNESLEPYPYDPERATQILEDQGWSENSEGWLEKDGKLLSMELTTATGVLDGPQLAEILKQQLEKIGIQTKINIVDFAYLWTGVFDGEITASVEYLVAPPSPDLFNDLSCDAGRNRFSYCNEQADAIMQEARATTDIDAQADLYEELQEVLYEDPPGIYLYYPEEVRVMTSRVHGVPEIPLREAFLYVHEFWVD